MSAEENSFLGQTVKWPIEFDGNGSVVMVSGIDNIKQAIIECVSTVIISLFPKPGYGCRAQELLFEPNDDITISMLRYFIREAIEKWEPRIGIDEIDFSINTDERAIYCTIYFEVITTRKRDYVEYTFKRAA